MWLDSISKQNKLNPLVHYNASETRYQLTGTDADSVITFNDENALIYKACYYQGLVINNHWKEFNNKIAIIQYLGILNNLPQRGYLYQTKNIIEVRDTIESPIFINNEQIVKEHASQILKTYSKNEIMNVLKQPELFTGHKDDLFVKLYKECLSLEF